MRHAGACRLRRGPWLLSQLPTVNIVPDPVQAQASRERAVRFFKKNL